MYDVSVDSHFYPCFDDHRYLADVVSVLIDLNGVSCHERFALYTIGVLPGCEEGGGVDKHS